MKKDLIILVADKNMESAVDGILPRHQSLGIHPLSYVIQVHPQHDSGVRKTGAELLRTQLGLFHHALMIYDYEGAGCDDVSIDILEDMGDKRLRQAGWEDRARTIVIDPELDIWVWADSPHVPEKLGWKNDYQSLKHWLLAKGFKFKPDNKPIRPKESIEAVLRINRIPRSSALYKRIAQRVGFTKCTDRSFVKLRTTLKNWFAP